jgi:phosphoribosylglycinamide formyltransferase-1
MKRLRLGVLVSGGGTNLQAIINNCREGRVNAEVVVVISDNPEAFALERAQRVSIPAATVNRADFSAKPEFDRAVLKELQQRDVDLVVLAGYMRIVGKKLLEAYRGRMMNIHPALLPSFGGRGMTGLKVHQAVIEHGAKISGCTVHFVDESVDGGPIILQRAVPVLDDDTPETLAHRILAHEHQIYSEAIQLFAEGRLKIEGRRVLILPQRALDSAASA